jgi:hypothetical protein
MLRDRIRGATATVAVGTVLTAGGIAWEEVGHSSGRTRPSSEQTQSTRPEPSSSPSEVDEATAAKACSLLTFDQVKQLTGIVVHTTQRESSAEGEGTCYWVGAGPAQGVLINLTLIKGFGDVMQCIPNGSYVPVEMRDSTLPKECLVTGGASIVLSNERGTANVTVARNAATQDAKDGLAVAEAIRPKI